MIGQGFQTLFVITTNETIDALHPAIVRPGRCLANLEFTPFSALEAAAWLGTSGPTKPATLAELYAIASQSEVLEATKPASAPGQYL
jgi:hypothetical protein